MPMRIDCKNYESRSYPSGDTVRSCRLDLAPEAPWRCPEDCPKFQRKMMDGGWITGSLSPRPTPDEPPKLDEDAVALLDKAEDIINAIGPETIAEVERQRQERQLKQSRKQRWWWPFS